MGSPMERKTFVSEVKAFDKENLIVEHFISTESPDRDGDIVRAKGMQIKGKPVVLLQHGRTWTMDAEPIAKPLSFDKKAMHKGVPGIMAKTQFFPDETGERLFQKNIGGYMPNWSIGFIPLRSKPIMEEATGKETRGREILDWELLEYSLVAVPSQADAQTPGSKAGVGPIRVKFFEPGATVGSTLCPKCGGEGLAYDVDTEKGIGTMDECPVCTEAEGKCVKCGADEMVKYLKEGVLIGAACEKCEPEETKQLQDAMRGEKEGECGDPAVPSGGADKPDKDMENIKAAVITITVAVKDLAEAMIDTTKDLAILKVGIEELVARGVVPATPPPDDKNNPPDRGNGGETAIRGEEAALLVGEIARRAAEDRVRDEVDKIRGKVK